MCGIAGILNFDGTALEAGALENFTDSMYHRGPDGSGYEYFENRTIGLGHRRLSILDLSDAGKQPMSYADDRYSIAYNGEIFNFIELKQELEAKGFSFKSDTDTEVVIAAYIAWGKECQHRFNGMWALAIWDNKTKELFISRDRFGIKPFYYNCSAKQFSFASETFAFKHLDSFDREIVLEHLQALQSDIYALEGRGLTLYKNLFSLLPGHCAIVTLEQGKVEQERWFDLNNHIEDRSSYSFEENTKAFQELLYDSCQRRLISDVPVATALSGGLDSSSVYSTVNSIIKSGEVSRMNENSQQAFVATFPGLESDETAYAESVVKFLNGKAKYLPHTEVNTDLLERETTAYDSFTNAPLYSVSSVYRGMRESGIVVSMDGHGVDEMLYGYRDMVYNLYNHQVQNNNFRESQEISKVLTDLYHPNYQQGLTQRLTQQMDQMSSFRGRAKSRFKQALRPIIKPTEFQRESYAWPNLETVVGSPYDFSDMEIPEKMLHNEFLQRTLPTLLRNFDFAGMINSVEIRMPFMDWRLVSFLYGLPMNQKIGQGYTKRIVRESMKGKLPEDVRLRTFKVGIGSPWQHWEKTTLQTWTKDMYHSKKVQDAQKILGDDANKWSAINLALIS